MRSLFGGGGGGGDDDDQQDVERGEDVEPLPPGVRPSRPRPQRPRGTGPTAGGPQDTRPDPDQEASRRPDPAATEPEPTREPDDIADEPVSRDRARDIEPTPSRTEPAMQRPERPRGTGPTAGGAQDTRQRDRRVSTSERRILSGTEERRALVDSQIGAGDFGTPPEGGPDVGRRFARGIAEDVTTARRDVDIERRLTTGGIFPERGPGGPFGITERDISREERRVRAGERGLPSVRSVRRGGVFEDTLLEGIDPEDPMGTPPRDEAISEGVVEGAAVAGLEILNVPQLILAGETALEAGTSLPGTIQEEGFGRTAETGVALARDEAIETAEFAQRSPGRFGGGAAVGLAGPALGARGLGTRAGLRREFDPRVSLAGRTAGAVRRGAGRARERLSESEFLQSAERAEGSLIPSGRRRGDDVITGEDIAGRDRPPAQEPPISATEEVRTGGFTDPEAAPTLTRLTEEQLELQERARRSSFDVDDTISPSARGRVGTGGAGAILGGRLAEAQRSEVLTGRGLLPDTDVTPGVDVDVGGRTDTDIRQDTDIMPDVDTDTDLDFDQDTDIDIDTDTDIDRDFDRDIDLDFDRDVDTDLDPDRDRDFDRDFDRDVDRDVDIPGLFGERRREREREESLLSDAFLFTSPVADPEELLGGGDTLPEDDLL